MVGQVIGISSEPYVALLLIAANVLISMRGFRDLGFRYRYIFNVGKVRGGDYIRLVSAGFLHADWTHLIFNMLTLYFFADFAERILGVPLFLLLYFGGMLAAKGFALLFHWKNPEYSALGASGAVMAVVFGSIMITGGAGKILLFFVLPMPTWLYGIGYILYTLFGIQHRRSNIGHEAHLGGAVFGVLFSIVLLLNYGVPVAWWLAGVLMAPVAFFMFLFFRYPQFQVLPFTEAFKSILPKPGEKKPSGRMKVVKSPGRENRRLNPEEELDALLDKVARKGLKGLSQIERSRLDELSRQLNPEKGKSRGDDPDRPHGV